MGRFDGKVALVSGAASGVGEVTAAKLAEQGATVALADMNLAGAERVAAQIAAVGGRAKGFEFELSDTASVERLIAQVVAEFGALDVLINNAASTHLTPMDHPISDADPALWDQTFAINVRGTMWMIRTSIPHLVASKGAVVNIASDAGLSGDFGPPAYSASKAAVINLTQHAATLLGRQGVRVNAVAPGLVNTPPSRETIETMGSIFLANTLLSRLAEPGDIANAALFLACDEASFITGQVLSVDGGYLAHQPHYSELNSLMGS